MGTLVPLLIKALPAVVQLVPVVERLFKGPKQGEAKRTVVVEVVKVLILGAEALANKDLIQDNALFAQGVGQIVDGVVAVMNATGKLKSPVA